MKILKEAVRSTVISGETITLFGGARVVGRRLQARKDIEAGSAGSETGVPTLLAAGVDPLGDLEAAPLAYSVRRAAAVRARLERIGEAADPDRRPALDALLARQRTKNEERAGQPSPGRGAEGEPSVTEARVHISGAIHPGVRIIIGPAELSIEEERRGGTFYYDAASGEVVGLYRGER